MAGGEKLLLANIEPDRNGEVDWDESMTLGDLHRIIHSAIDSGIPDDAPIKFGYLPDRLVGGLYVEKPIDLTDKGFDYLRDRASSVRPDVSNEAWAEIRRRLEALGRPGDHDD